MSRTWRLWLRSVPGQLTLLGGAFFGAVVLAVVSVDDPTIDSAYRLSPDLFLSGAEVHAKVRCGNHRMGYSLFYGVWEFFYEKVIFFFF